MNVGLFGGSFNPPHLGHLLVAERMREQFGLDRILWMPAGLPPHKQAGRLASPEDRLRMVELATGNNLSFEVSDLELRRPGPSYTVDTLRTLQAENPAASYALLLGGDSLRELPTWRSPEEILERVPLLVYRRPGEDARPPNPRWAGRVRFADAPLLGLSSTEIRARMAEGASVRYMVPDPVLEYIEARALYRSAVPASEPVTGLP